MANNVSKFKNTADKVIAGGRKVGRGDQSAFSNSGKAITPVGKRGKTPIGRRS